MWDTLLWNRDPHFTHVFFKLHLYLNICIRSNIYCTAIFYKYIMLLELTKQFLIFQAWGILVPWSIPPALEAPNHQGIPILIFFFLISFLQNLVRQVLPQFYRRKCSSERNFLDARWERQTSKYTLFLGVYHFLIVSLWILAWSKNRNKTKTFLGRSRPLTSHHALQSHKISLGY